MPRFRVGKRRSKRIKSVVPVRLWIAGSKDSHLAHTLDVSEHGVRLGGFRGEVKIGDKIEIEYHYKKGQFRVAWITAREGSSEKQIGAECMEPESRFGVLNSQSRRMSTKNKNDRGYDDLFTARLPFVGLRQLGGNGQVLRGRQAACS